MKVVLRLNWFLNIIVGVLIMYWGFGNVDVLNIVWLRLFFNILMLLFGLNGVFIVVKIFLLRDLVGLLCYFILLFFSIGFLV